MSKSASLPAEQFEPFDGQPSESSTAAWKQEVNQRLAAHRTRRGVTQDATGHSAAESPKTANSRAAQAAARVAARYAKAPSYSELLAGEARAVVRAAGAAAEAARNAQAAAQAVLAGLESAPVASGLWEPATPETSHRPAQASEESPSAHVTPSRWQDEAPAQGTTAHSETAWAAPQPRWEEALPVTPPPPSRDVWSEMRLHSAEPVLSGTARYDLGLGYGPHYAHDAEEGELFPYDSHDAVASATIEPVQHIPANLIEFPRELIATRKARPRLADGPYREGQESPQLSIFEVDPDLLAPPQPISHTGEEIAPPEWASIELDHHEPEYHAAETQHAQAGQGYADHGRASRSYASYASTYEYDNSASDASYEEDYAEAVHAHAAATQATYTNAVRAEAYSATERTAGAYRGDSAVKAAKPAAKREEAADAEPVVRAELLVASMGDRLLAGVVDTALVMLAFLAAAVVVTASTAHPPTGRIALIATGCGLALFGLLYQFLFLSYAEEGTPGMRYARIALCTFDDDNPSREQMRKRIPAMMLAGLPLGLGLLWAVADKEKLGWHDRMTKTYQRKY